MKKRIKHCVKYHVSELAGLLDGQSVLIKGQILKLRKMKTKNGDGIACSMLEDSTGCCEIVLFPNAFTKCSDLLENNKMVVVKGAVQIGESDLKIMVEDIFEE